MSKAWMPFYVGDYLADTQHLNALQHGAYLLLMLHYWQHGYLPTDEKNLQKISRLTPHLWRKNFKILRSFFQNDWQHKRINKEIEKARIISIKRQIYGQKGGMKTAGYASSAMRAAQAKALIKAEQKPYQSQSHIRLVGEREEDGGL